MPDVHAYPLLTGAVALGVNALALEPPLHAPATYPPMLQMLPLALLFVVFVLCLTRLARGMMGRSPLLARLVARISPAIAIVCAAALAGMIFLGFITPLLRSSAPQALSGNAFDLLLLTGAVALLTMPMAWRECVRRLARATKGSEVRAISTRARIAWLCATACASAVATSQARLHQPPVSPMYGVLQFSFLAIFLLTLFPAIERLKDAFRRPSDPPTPSP